MLNANPMSYLADVTGDEIPGPQWKDGCGHTDSYVGTVTYFRNRGNGIEEHCADVYVFKNGHRQDVCIRFGSECHEYVSPGTPCDVLATVARHGDKLPEYKAALGLLLKHGVFTWFHKTGATGVWENPSDKPA